MSGENRGGSNMSHHGETHSERLARKARDAPFMVAGLAGLTGLVAYGIYGFKNRQLKTSLYLIQLRVGAQGFVVACLTAGVGYNLYNKFIAPKFFPESTENTKE